jgi:hypothetical protein
MKAFELLPILLANPEAELYTIEQDKTSTPLTFVRAEGCESGADEQPDPIPWRDVERDFFGNVLDAAHGPVDDLITRKIQHAPQAVSATLKMVFEMLTQPCQHLRTETPSGVVVEDLGKQIIVETSPGRRPQVRITHFTRINGNEQNNVRQGPGDAQEPQLQTVTAQVPAEASTKGSRVDVPHRIELNSLLQQALTKNIITAAQVEQTRKFVEECPHELEGCIQRTRRALNEYGSAPGALGGLASLGSLSKEVKEEMAKAREAFPTRTPGGAR